MKSTVKSIASSTILGTRQFLHIMCALNVFKDSSVLFCLLLSMHLTFLQACNILYIIFKTQRGMGKNGALNQQHIINFPILDRDRFGFIHHPDRGRYEKKLMSASISMRLEEQCKETVHGNL